MNAHPKKYRVLLLGPIPPAIGGIATHMDHLIHGPLHRDFEIFPMATMSRKHGQPDYHNESIVRKCAQILSDAFKEIGMLLFKKPSLVHINSSFNTGAFWRDALYILIARLWRRPVFLQMHGGNLGDFIKRYPQFIQSNLLAILRCTSRISVLSKVQSEPLKEAGLSEQALILPNMIDCQQYDCSAKEAMRDHEATFIVIASHFTKSKGVYDILEAFEITLQHCPQCQLIMVGGGREAGTLKTLCQEKAYGHRVRFTGFIEQQQISAYLHQSDVFVLPSHSEGFPMVVLEAMACGLPVISTEVGAIPEMLETPDHSFIIPVGDVDAMAARMTQLAESANLRHQRGRANRHRVEKQFDIHIVSNQFASIYRELIQ